MYMKLDVSKSQNGYWYQLNNDKVHYINDTPEDITYIQQIYDVLDSLLRRLPCGEFIFNTSRLTHNDPVRLYVDQKEAEREIRPHSLQMACVSTIRRAMRNKCDESFYSLGLPQRLVQLVTYDDIAKELGFIYQILLSWPATAPCAFCDI